MLFLICAEILRTEPLFLLSILLVLATFACFSAILYFLSLIPCLCLFEKNSNGSTATLFYTLLARDS